MSYKIKKLKADPISQHHTEFFPSRAKASQTDIQPNTTMPLVE